MKEDESTRFTNYLLTKGYSSGTIERYTLDVLRFEKWTIKENIPLESVSYNDVLLYIQYNKKTLTQASVGHLVNSVKHYFNYLIFAEKIQDNPTDQIQIKGIRRRKLYDILSKQELENLFHNYQLKEDKTKENFNWYQLSRLTYKRNKIMLGLLVFQGLTATELNRLKVVDVKLREGKIFIAGTRRSNEREMNLESHQMLDMMEYILKTRAEFQNYIQKQNDFLFNSNGVSNNLNNTLTKLMQKLKAQDIKLSSIKQIRTSVITTWLKQYNLRQVQHMAGHRYVSSTESYQINDVEGLLEDIEKFHPIG